MSRNIEASRPENSFRCFAHPHESKKPKKEVQSLFEAAKNLSFPITLLHRHECWGTLGPLDAIQLLVFDNFSTFSIKIRRVPKGFNGIQY